MDTSQETGQGSAQKAPGSGSTSVAADQLRTICERIERLEEEKKAIADDVKDVYVEAKANGFDVKTLRKVVRLRKIEAIERQEQAAMLDLYLSALNMHTSFDFH